MREVWLVVHGAMSDSTQRVASTKHMYEHFWFSFSVQYPLNLRIAKVSSLIPSLPSYLLYRV